MTAAGGGGSFPAIFEVDVSSVRPTKDSPLPPSPEPSKSKSKSNSPYPIILICNIPRDHNPRSPYPTEPRPSSCHRCNCYHGYGAVGVAMPRAAAAATSGVEFHFIGGTWGHIVSTMMFHSLFCTVQVRIKVNVTNLVEKRGWRYNVWHQKMF